MSGEKPHWYDMIDWSKGDWKQAHAMQQKYDNSDLFPVVLSDNKKDASINIGSDPNEEFTNTINDNLKPPTDNLDVEMKLIEGDIDPSKVTCKVEAKMRNESLQGDRRDDGDGPAIRLNQLRREVTPGTSVLSLLSNNYSNCENLHESNEYAPITC